VNACADAVVKIGGVLDVTPRILGPVGPGAATEWVEADGAQHSSI